MTGQAFVAYREGFQKITETLFYDSPELSVREIAEKMCVDTVTASMIVHCLEMWAMIRIKTDGYKIRYRPIITINK